MAGVLKLLAPVSGQLLRMADVPDPVFAEGMMGDGVAILPAAGEVRAPLSGTVEVLFPTGHAVAIRSPEGVEVLIHIGLESAKVAGLFTPAVAQGDQVRAGDLLVSFDPERLRREAASPVTPVVVTGLPEGAGLTVGAPGGTVKAGTDAVASVAL